MIAHALAAAARSLVGVKFRLHGRDPAHGLDCIGVIEAALARCNAHFVLPNGYALRSSSRPDADAHLAAAGFVPISGPRMPGDILMVRPGPCQFHFAIATTPCAIVHAHAGLGRVVESPLPDAWPIAGHWRDASPQPPTS